jgi:hypothetical protein
MGLGNANCKHQYLFFSTLLEEHHDREGPLLGPLIGERLTRSVERECSQITSLFDELEKSLKDAELARMRPADLASKADKAGQIAAKLSELVNKHSRNIDTLVEMLNNADRTEQ